MKLTQRQRFLLPAMALLLSLDLTVGAGMMANANTLDLMFGEGEQAIVSPKQTAVEETSYYQERYTTASEAKDAALQISRQVSDEGIVLLKNDGLLPLARETYVTPLGLRYFQPYYGGTGSSAISIAEGDVTTPAQGLQSVFLHVNEEAVQRQGQALKGQAALDDNSLIAAAYPVQSGVDAALYEFSEEVFEGLEATCRGTVALVYIGRQTGENHDAYPGAYDDGTVHMLSLTAAERSMIDFAAGSCAHVVVILASASPMEIPELADDPRVNALLWIGGAGSTGYASAADILCGDVNPSGRLPTTFCADFQKDPTFANHDDGSSRFVYTNAFTTLVESTGLTEDVPTAFHEYEEGVYLGYRYYETAYAMGDLKDYFDRARGVVYPFGYGLSYTSFSQEITGLRIVGGQVQVDVRVCNEGSTYAGAEVVQLYVTPPYTSMDEALGIEKPAASLVQFEKTNILQPRQIQEMTLAFSTDQLTSYCAAHSNGDGTQGAYVLEKGDYVLSLRSDAHRVLDTESMEIGSTVWYSGSTPRQTELEAQAAWDRDGVPIYDYVLADVPIAAVNRFDTMNRYASGQISGMISLTRSNWANTQPTPPEDDDRIASQEIVTQIAASDVTRYDAWTDCVLDNIPSSVVYTQSAPRSADANGVVFADLRGKDYDDPLWELLLDQVDYSDREALRLVLFQGAYRAGELKALQMPASVAYDGPQGLTLADGLGRNWLKEVCGYPAAPVMAATWNPELMYRLGEMVGQEALIAGIDGWYAPGLNVLRSPFCGRVSEYYSEDPLLAGLLGAQVISGAGDAGLSCAVKHFALMETEAHRSPHTCTWMTEQALREIYLKPFELALKTARKTIRYYNGREDAALSQRVMRAGNFIMASDCAVGSEWSASNYALLTEIVRGEWGFEGTIISDMHMGANSAMVDKLLRAGCDMLMTSSTDSSVNASDYETPTGQSLLRRAVKNLCYTLVNSGLTQGMAPASVVEYRMSAWKKGLICANGVTAVLLICGVFMFFKKSGRG